MKDVLILACFLFSLKWTYLFFVEKLWNKQNIFPRNSSKECDNPGCRKKTFVFAKLGGFLRLTRTPPFFARHPGSWFFRESILTEQGITRVRFLHSSLHILCFDICIDWQENKQMTRLNSLHPSLGACKTANKNQKTKKTTTLCLRHSGPVGFLGFLVVFSVYVFFVFLGFLILHECIIVLAPSLLLWTFCCSVLTHLALSHHPTPWKVSPCLLSHTSGYHPNVHVFLIFSWFGHPPRKLLKKMGENTTQPRLENIISKQVSAWPLTFLFKPSNNASCSIFSRI